MERQRQARLGRCRVRIYREELTPSGHPEVKALKEKQRENEPTLEREEAVRPLHLQLHLFSSLSGNCCFHF